VIEIYQPRWRIVGLAAAPENELAAVGSTLVFEIGGTIETLDALQGSPGPVATTTSPAIGLSIVGRKVAWAENDRRGAGIRMLELR
jgi:hypothetical protein